MFCTLKTRKYILATFQNITQSVKKKIILLTIPKGEGCRYISVKKRLALGAAYTLKHSMTKEITIIIHNTSNYDYHFII